MKHWQAILISLSVVLLILLPTIRTQIAPIRYIVKAPQHILEGQKSGSIYLELENRFFTKVRAQVTLWGATTPKQDFEFNDYNVEIPFNITENAKAVVYQLRLSSNRGDYAFIGRIELPQNDKQQGLQLITERQRYNPGDTIRALALEYSEKRGLKADKAYEITLTDNRQNIIDNQKLYSDDGILIYEFPLADKVNYGEWSLKINDGQTIKQRTFEVLNFVTKRVDLRITTNTGYLSEQEDNIINIKAKHFAGGSLLGNSLILSVLDEEGLILTKTKKIESELTKIILPNKFIIGKHSLTLKVKYSDSTGIQEQQIVLPIHKTSATIIAYPKAGYILPGHPNKIHIKLFSDQTDSQLQILYNNNRLPYKQISKNLISITTENFILKLFKLQLKGTWGTQYIVVITLHFN